MKAQIFVSLIKLVARLAGDIELAAQRRHLLPFKQAGDETQPFVHLLTLLPGHLRLPQKPKSVSDVTGMTCKLCPRKHTALQLFTLYPLLYPFLTEPRRAAVDTSSRHLA